MEYKDEIKTLWSVCRKNDYIFFTRRTYTIEKAEDVEEAKPFFLKHSDATSLVFDDKLKLCVLKSPSRNVNFKQFTVDIDGNHIFDFGIKEIK